MNEKEVKIVIAGLLHDIGKVIYREGGDSRKHSLSGYDYLKTETKMTDSEILDGVRYHHAQQLKGAGIGKNSIAYLTYMADNIASATDRREKDEQESGFEIATPLESIFNILNGNHQKMYYKPDFLNPDTEINFPRQEKQMFDRHMYHLIKTHMTENLNGVEYNNAYINSLLEVLEANLSYVPSSTSKNEIADISLFDHVKLTAAMASCIYQYLEEQKITDYKNELFTNGKAFYQKDAFILYSMDISGIQDFIYTIHSENAMKMLRSKSFYLEIMMEHIIDSLLERLNLSRANLIYSGGGHCYLLLPNTQNVKDKIQQYHTEINTWFLEHFQVSLYIAGGYSVCSSDSLKNVPEGSYAQIFKNISRMISTQKASRYTAGQLIALNRKKESDYSRECRVCRRIESVDENGLCPHCSALKELSGKILNEKYAFFTILSEKEDNALELPLGYYLVAEDEKELQKRMLIGDSKYVRTYGKNKMYTGKNVATKLWVGNYHSDCNTFEEMAKKSEGIERIGVYKHDYPISVIANEVADMESMSKSRAEKNSITIFDDGAVHTELDREGFQIEIGDGTYSWQEFQEKVLEEKYRCIENFFDMSDERGLGFLYNLLELIRRPEEKINFARIVYVLARLEPTADADEQQKKQYEVFSKNLYQWVNTDGKESPDIRHLKTAMQLYSYIRRQRESEKETEGTQNED
ncbi:MAG: type III-A CRISPR-associated protein Cas10/Csm1 [Lachnospira sp.]